MRRVLATASTALLLLLAARAHAIDRATPSAPPGAAPPAVVNLNEASGEQLELLPGIGPVKARAIVDHRKGHPFRKIEELMKVKGIGRKTFGRLRPYLTLSGSTTLREPAARHHLRDDRDVRE